MWLLWFDQQFPESLLFMKTPVRSECYCIWMKRKQFLQLLLSVLETLHSPNKIKETGFVKKVSWDAIQIYPIQLNLIERTLGQWSKTFSYCTRPVNIILNIECQIPSNVWFFASRRFLYRITLAALSEWVRWMKHKPMWSTRHEWEILLLHWFMFIVIVCSFCF